MTHTSRLSSGYHVNIVIAGLCIVLACGLGYWYSQLKQERDNYKRYYENYQKMKK